MPPVPQISEMPSAKTAKARKRAKSESSYGGKYSGANAATTSTATKTIPARIMFRPVLASVAR